jgi:probable addiction module antidote protein
MPTTEFKDSAIANDLKDIEFASAYLEQALEESVQDFIIAIRNVADANGGIGKLSKLSDLGRESLYKSLSQEGTSSPYFSTIHQVLDALGLQIVIQPKCNNKEVA